MSRIRHFARQQNKTSSYKATPERSWRRLDGFFHTVPTAPVSNVVNPTSTSNELDPQQLKQIVDAVVASLQDKAVVKKVELSQSKLEVISVAVVAQVVRKKKRTFIWQAVQRTMVKRDLDE